MSIGTNDLILKHSASLDTIVSSGSIVAADAFSVSGDITTWTNDEDAPMASLVFQGTFDSAPAANKSIAVFARPLNVDGTSDQDEPTDNFPHILLGAIPVKDVATAQVCVSDHFELMSSKDSQEWDIYIRNDAGVQLNAGWSLKIRGVALGPSA